MAEQTLFERVGGEATVASLVEAFYARVLADPELAPFFEHTPMDKLRRMQHEFFAAALDGPIEYRGRTMSEVHTGRGIRAHHLARFVDHLMATLRDQPIGDADAYDIVSRINTWADEITGESTVDG